nr:unnamed protein product [Callosobruchus analis]
MTHAPLHALCDPHRSYASERKETQCFPRLVGILVRYLLPLRTVYIKMDWNNDKTIEFIDSYRNFTCLWRSEDPNYKNRIIRNDAVQELGTKYSITPKQVLNKIKSLRSYFHKEHTKVTKNKSGSATSDTYKSSWFAYTSMLFILDGDSQRSGIETEVSDYGIQENSSDNEKNSEIEQKKN